jgi:hypothetical protein
VSWRGHDLNFAKGGPPGRLLHDNPATHRLDCHGIHAKYPGTNCVFCLSPVKAPENGRILSALALRDVNYSQPDRRKGFDGMTQMYRVAGSLMMLSAVAFSVSSCMGPTYGTGKSANEQLVEDLGDAFSLAPAKKPATLAYQPRGALVKPAEKEKLVEPEKNLASKDNPQWVESPEEARARLKAEADENADNGSYRSPLAVSVTEGKVLSPEQQRAAYREARKIQDGRYSDRRRFMSDPPLEYRQVDDPAKLQELGESETVKEKRRKEEAAIAGTGRKWWQVWD